MRSDHLPGKNPIACSPFHTHLPLAEAKRALGLDPDALHLVVLVSDTPGCFLSDLLSMVYIGDDHDSEISVLCAGNGALFHNLNEEVGHLETIHLYDTESDRDRLLDSADLLLTEGQDSLLAEALKRKLPLVLIGTAKQDACSTLVDEGCAVASQNEVELAKLCIKLLDDTVLRAKMSNAYGR